MEFAVLNNGMEMPLVGFGTWDLRGGECAAAVEQAISLGYHLIDTARMYGNEEAVGRGIQRSGVPRERIFLTSKVYRPDNSYAGTLKAIDQSLRALDTDYIDLYLIHEPYREAPEMYRVLEEALQDGKLRAVGVSNFNAQQYEGLLQACRIVPAVDQVGAHVYFQQQVLQKTLEAHGTHMEAWSPFAAGMREIFRDPVLAAIGRAHGKTAAQTALRSLVQRGITAIPKSSSPKRMAENLELFDFTLSPKEMEQIRALDGGKTLFGWY